MKENLIFAINAVGPIMVFIVLGYMVRRLGIAGEDFFRQGNRFVFRVLIPASSFNSVYSCPGIVDLNISLVLFSTIAVTVIAAFGLLTTHIFIRDPLSYSAAHQCSFRSNTPILGTALAVSLSGEQGGIYVSMIMLLLVPLMNIFAVTSLTFHPSAGGEKKDLRAALAGIATNPLILSCVAGLIVLVIRYYIPVDAEGVKVFTIKEDLPVIYNVISKLAASTLPISLVILGGLMDFSAVGGAIGPIMYGVISKLFIAPLIAVSMALFCDRQGITCFGAPEYATLLSVFGSSIAIAAGPMTAEMGGDGELARQYVMYTNLFLIISMPLEIVLMRTMGLF